MTKRSLVLPLIALTLASAACKPAPTKPPPVPTTSPTDDILAASDLPPTLAAPLPGDGMGVTIHRLKNGLTVYISTDRQKPRIAAWVAVRTGSRNDPPNSTGLAHYLEHMLFKGTDELGTLDYTAEKPHLDKVRELYKALRATDDPAKRQAIFAELDASNQAISKLAVPNEMDRLYTTLGVEGINAFTSDDMTVYIGDLPTNRLEAWATLEAERFKDPSYRLFFTELESVYEEKNLSLDSPDGRASEAMMKQLFPTHPYGTQTTIGSIEHLKSPAYQDMIDYHQRWYAPNNMAVLLAGDIDAAAALPVLERTLGTWAPRKLEPPTPATPTKITARVASEVIGEGEQAVSLGWSTVPYTHPDEPVLTVMHWLLDNGTSGLLNAELELTQKVPDAAAYGYSILESGIFIVRATAREGQPLEDVEQLLLGVVAKLKAGGFNQADIDAIVLANDIGRKFQQESNDGRVGKLMESFIYRQPWAKMLERDERLRKVTREDVMRVANEYLGPGFSAVYRRAGKPVVAKIDKPTITPIEVDPARKSKFGAAIEAMKAPELNPEWLVEGTHYTRHPLPAGELIAVKNTRNDLFQLSYRFDRGHKRERMLCHALDLLEQSGAGDQSAEAFKKQLFALGSSISFSCGADTSGVRVSGIDANMEKTLALLDAWFRQPKLDPETLRKLGENRLSTRKDGMEDPDNLWGVLGDYAQFDREADALHEPTNKQITGAKVAPLAKLITGALDHQHRSMYYGPRAGADVAKVVALGKDHKKLTRRAPLNYRKPKTPTIYFVHREVAKSYVSVALPHGPGERAKKPAAELLNTYLNGGMNALLFQEMREARGLVYFSYGAVNKGQYPDDPWAMTGGMGTQVDKTPDALTTFLELVRTKPLDTGRIAIARTTLDQEYRSSRIDPRWSVFWISSWDDAGEPSDPRPWYWEQIKALKDDELRAFAGSFADKPVVVAIIGDRTRVNLDALKKIGTVIELSPDKLFSYGAFPKARPPRPNPPLHPQPPQPPQPSPPRLPRPRRRRRPPRPSDALPVPRDSHTGPVPRDRHTGPVPRDSH
ncbi:M16 family metallopeptidase [Nannocystis sp.]|uniref:M16 family metallopeptidase n=1 Tax=Nannocystis sp. TaxID=1962667 RepID=UPI0025FA7676|nr:M16 family metallopeptidase [Nannocystis sp.]MBK7824301.1 insulinase family protein [Nannocystis sp.]